MIKSNCTIFMCSNDFFIFFLTYIKMLTYLSAKYYQNNKEILQKLACERYQSLYKEEKKKN